MDILRWQRVKAIVQFLLDLDPAERPAFLDRTCAGDPELRREVESLLQANEEAGGFLHDSPLVDSIQTTGTRDQVLPGGRIGAYRITEEIGAGGMGTLYVGVREDQFQKKVAIKVVKRGMDSNSIVRRFQRERQILAGLNHPNITMLLDGGAIADGRPYFIMEYVDGKPITDYCDAHKLSTRQRLELFRTVCSAVHYAHQNLVVHRDLKPSNILVTNENVPKLLDFGIAKILNVELTGASLDLTMASMRPMTPEYASPEQVRGEPITTATDVYSLGVLLYELLTGHKPYRLKTRTPQEMADAICQQEPEKPSTAVGRNGHPEPLRKRLRGDLDNIVLKAMHKEPQRRYASVEQFSHDIERHLTGLPVIARKDTLGYRAGKFIRRHKAGVIAAALLALSLIAGIIGTGWQARIAAVQRRKAERHFNDVRKLANSVLFELHDGIETLPGSTPVRELLVKRALEYLDSLAKESEGDVSLQRELATAYERVASVQGEPARANLGDTRGARESLRKAIAIREKILATTPASRASRRELAASYGKFSEILGMAGDRKGGLEYSRKALAICEDLSATNPGDPQARLDLATAHQQVSAGLAGTGDDSGALEHRRTALAIFKEVAAADPGNDRTQLSLARVHKHVGGTLADRGQLDEGLENYHSALAIEEAILAREPANTQVRMGISYDLGDIGFIYIKKGDLPEALQYYRQALAIRESLVAADPKDARARFGLATTHDRIGYILTKMGQTTGALEHFRKTLDIREELVRADPTNDSPRIALASAYEAVGWAYATAAKSKRQKSLWREARLWLVRSLDAYQALDARGALHGKDAEGLREVKKDLAECEAALAQIR